jgi:hypothetical protein
VVEKKAVAEIAAKAREIFLLHAVVTLLSGEQKQLRFGLGAELDQLGASFQKIAAKVGPTNMVGEVLVEAEVKALLCIT